MHKLIIIIGLFLLGQANASAADSIGQNNAIYQGETHSIVRCDTVHSALSAYKGDDDRSKPVNMNENDPPSPTRGSPDNRGGGSR